MIEESLTRIFLYCLVIVFGLGLLVFDVLNDWRKS